MLTYMEYCLALNTFLKFTNQQNLYLFPSQVTLFTDIQRETFEPQGPIRMFLFTTDQYSGNIKVPITPKTFFAKKQKSIFLGRMAKKLFF